MSGPALRSRLTFPLRTTAFALVLAAAAAPVAHAAGTKVFRQTTAKELEEGEAAGGQILPSGEVVPGFKATRVPIEAGFVWCSAASVDGKTAYLGTGDPGRIFATTAGGADDAPARKVVDVDAPWVTAMVARSDGQLLAGSSPGGRVFLADPARGTSRELGRVAAEHVWALVHDAKSGVTYAGTGAPGKIVAIERDGKTRVVWDSGDKHVVSLADAGGGVLLAGTSGDGVLWRVRAADGRAEAVQDFEADEVRALLRTADATYVAVNDFDREAGRSDGESSNAAKGTKIVSSGSSPASAGALPRPGGSVKAKSAVYRLDADGRIEQIFNLGDGYLTGLLADAAGAVYVSAGVDGKVYRLLPDRSATLAVDLPERQALTLLRTSGGLLVGTGDGAAVFRTRAAAVGEAVYRSKVLDAEYPARWGRLRVAGEGPFTVETRTGHTTKPDRSWSDWRKLDGVASSGDETDGLVASPSARYIQYRVTLGSARASLRDAWLYYEPQNQRPRITEVTAAESGTSDKGAARTHSPLLKLRWKVENPDGDELVFRLWYKQESEPLWRPLGPTEPLTKAELDWNTDAVPDGRYVVKVWASDVKSVPQDRALEATFLSAPLLVDNTKPQVTGLAAAGGVVKGRATDAASPLAAIEVAVDGGEWRPAGAEDGVLDQRAEGFAFKIPGALAPGAHVVVVRAFDAADNVGSAKLVVETK